MKPIPVAAAESIAKVYGYDQIIVIGRTIGEGEHVTTYGVDKANCNVAACIGDFLKYKIMNWNDQPQKEKAHDTGKTHSESD